VKRMLASGRSRLEYDIVEMCDVRVSVARAVAPNGEPYLAGRYDALTAPPEAVGGIAACIVTLATGFETMPQEKELTP